MGRKPDARRRNDLLEAAAEYLMANGLADLSLRPLAVALRTSPRMLLYHFGSKERLVAEALARARERERDAIARAASRGGDVLGGFLSQWTWMTSSRAEPFLRLFFETYAMALQDPKRFEGFASRAVEDWLTVFERELRAAGLEETEARSYSTLLLATSRGLLLDLLATGDRTRVRRAANLLIEQLSGRIDQEQPKDRVRA